jgi:hypothetical protein
MDEAWLGSKYLVLAGKTLQIVICSLSGLCAFRESGLQHPAANPLPDPVEISLPLETNPC